MTRAVRLCLQDRSAIREAAAVLISMLAGVCEYSEAHGMLAGIQAPPVVQL